MSHQEAETTDTYILFPENRLFVSGFFSCFGFILFRASSCCFIFAWSIFCSISCFFCSISLSCALICRNLQQEHIYNVKTSVLICRNLQRQHIYTSVLTSVWIGLQKCYVLKVGSPSGPVTANLCGPVKFEVAQIGKQNLKNSISVNILEYFNSLLKWVLFTSVVVRASRMEN